MKQFRTLKFCLIIILTTLMVTSCWNYREIDTLAIVAGVAVDKGTQQKYKMTIEIVQVEGGKEAKTISKLIEIEGNTMFDAVRNALSLSGKKLYWSHNKVVIVSDILARQGLVPILDWFNRDAETRADFNILIAKGTSAREIFSSQGTTEAIQAYELNDMIKNQEHLSKAPQMSIWQFINDLQSETIAAVAPTITIKENKTKRAAIMGSALFKGDKLIGFLDGEETKDLLFVKNKIQGGLLVFKKLGKNNKTPTSLEVFESKTKIRPILKQHSISMLVNTETVVALDEIAGTENLIEEPYRTQLEHEAAKKLSARIEQTIRKVQTQYDVDPFGFAVKLQQDHPHLWDHLSGSWDDVYKGLKIRVKSQIEIRSSATMSKPLKIGE